MDSNLYELIKLGLIFLFSFSILLLFAKSGLGKVIGKTIGIIIAILLYIVVALLVLLVFSPLDFMPGPVDDVLYIIGGVLFAFLAGKLFNLPDFIKNKAKKIASKQPKKIESNNDVE
jgi:hypothetical protein